MFFFFNIFDYLNFSTNVEQLDLGVFPPSIKQYLGYYWAISGIFVKIKIFGVMYEEPLVVVLSVSTLFFSSLQLFPGQFLVNFVIFLADL